ncbi:MULTISPECIES: Holliday junction branch migration protein RuvA [Borreliella]|uniref:Holliday junction branch migration complex subunit RuvA n=2 Tax=Borrelia garinii subsp. bavariensis (strain ATCC BAA-2496 / DSM 23469 / PBi) TaxID=290434 RepID=RUVA_BORGP|nr:MULTISPECIES: Holliday junction branch migration protein RuvA [Borreliella]Q662Y9.1 RecName: Full=Holliday junction branch migration complex subunit RuvA [Borreliella bavariensis PBi]AAU06882.1 Holliday junction DNA helicase [Borreliella bavariensis PBi]AZA27074.1 Holliday junction branch migration protein RuvA [Borreliella bavariensis PBi]WLN23715.1 Holliday junction branch migration protein RuvA [Borreliella bavariensis]
MINKIHGKVIEKKESSLVLMTTVFEFELLVSAFCLANFKLSDKVELFTYLYARENELKLFGFLNSDERETFKSLIGVSGIGPRAALRVLSNIRYNDFKEAIDREDVELVSKIKGIGKKMAGKMFLHLQGKLLINNELESSLFGFKELEESIVSMGFDRKIVNSKLKEACDLIEFSNLKDSEKEQFLFKEVLKRMSN